MISLFKSSFFSLNLLFYISQVMAAAPESPPTSVGPCLPGYTIESGGKSEIWFHSLDGWLRPRHTRVAGDVVTFVRLGGASKGTCAGERFAKDTKNVYFEGRIVRGANAANAVPVLSSQNLALLDTGYISSAGKVFFEECMVENADPAGFIVEQRGLAHDKNAIYVGCNRFAANPLPRKLDGSFFVVGEKVYFNGHPVNGAVGVSAQPFGFDYARDGQHLIFRDTVLSNRDVKTFRFVDQKLQGARYTADQTGVYLGNKIIAGANSTSFKLIPMQEIGPKDPKFCSVLQCAQDKDRIFVEVPNYMPPAGTVGALEILAANRNEVQLLKGGFLRFGKYIFFGSGLLADADARTFNVLDEYGFAKDRKHVYCKQFLTNFDLATFEFWERMEPACGTNDRYVRDSHGVYLISGCDPDLVQPVVAADGGSFQPSGKSGCARDKRAIYRCGVVVNGFNGAMSCGFK